MLKDHSVILFQGDSITDMNRGRGTDPNHLYGHSYAFLLASQLGYRYPEKGFIFYNRGISGNRTVDLYSRWKEDALNLKPDVISILVGINDVALEIERQSGLDAAGYRKVLSLIIDETLEKNPNVQFVLCEPFAFPQVYKEEYRERLKEGIMEHQRAIREVASSYNCVFVPLQEDFDAAYEAHPDLGYPYWIWDGIHPTAAGHQIIAKKWLQCVASDLT